VGAHLQSHLARLPEHDAKSRAIVQQMYIDETQHANMATALGAAVLPVPVKMIMRFNGKLMTNSTYWV
jgi:ubiquinone biosynthesis monooxygenase Coq7